MNLELSLLDIFFYYKYSIKLLIRDGFLNYNFFTTIYKTHITNSNRNFLFSGIEHL